MHPETVLGSHKKILARVHSIVVPQPGHSKFDRRRRRAEISGLCSQILSLQQYSSPVEPKSGPLARPELKPKSINSILSTFKTIFNASSARPFWSGESRSTI